MAQKKQRQASVWPARLWLAGVTGLVAVVSAFLLVPGTASLVAPALGGDANARPLAESGLFMTVALLIALVLGWRDPYHPEALPSADRVVSDRPPREGLGAEKILEEEYEYASKTAEQAMEHRMTIVNFYLLIAGGAGSGVVALISSRPAVAVAAVPLLWIVALVGGLNLLQLIALRRAWAGSVMEMNYIKEFFVANSDLFEKEKLSGAFLWKPRTVPSTHRRGNVFYYSAILIALLNTAAFLGGMYILGLNAAPFSTPGSVIFVALLAVGFFQAHMWLYDMLLIPVPRKDQASTMVMPGPATQPVGEPVPQSAQLQGVPTARRTNFTPPTAPPNTVVASREVFHGKLITVRVDDIRQPDGHESVREIVQHGPAVVIAAYLEDSDEFLFIEQYRDALGKALVELPAGMVGQGEEPAATARRELLEETGYEVGSLRYLGSFYTSPGFTDEQLHLFLATQLRQVSGIQDTHEIAALHRLARSDAIQQIMQRQITDGKTIIGLFWADRELPTRV
jgi:ADP-ribose pyrophosphatase